MPSMKELSHKSLKVLFSIKKYMEKILNFPIASQCRLFSALVRPILTSNAEIWYMDVYQKLLNAKMRAKNNNKEFDYFSIIDKFPFEQIHLKFCKQTLRLPKRAVNLGSRAELGQYPIDTNKYPSM